MPCQIGLRWKSVRDGKVYKQRYEKGNVCFPLKEIGTCPEDQTGTKVTFLPDETIFTETTVFDLIS